MALLSAQCPTPPPTKTLLPFLPFCAIARSPLNPAALAFVPFGIVLVRVRVRVAAGGSFGLWRCFIPPPLHVSQVDEGRIRVRVAGRNSASQGRQCTALSPQLLVALKSARRLAIFAQNLDRALFSQAASAACPPGSPWCRLLVTWLPHSK